MKSSDHHCQQKDSCVFMMKISERCVWVVDGGGRVCSLFVLLFFLLEA